MHILWIWKENIHRTWLIEFINQNYIESPPSAPYSSSLQEEYGEWEEQRAWNRILGVAGS